MGGEGCAIAGAESKTARLGRLGEGCCEGEILEEGEAKQATMCSVGCLESSSANGPCRTDLALSLFQTQ